MRRYFVNRPGELLQEKKTQFKYKMRKMKQSAKKVNLVAVVIVKKIIAKSIDFFQKLAE